MATIPVVSAISTASFIATLGVNTHLDLAAYGYQNLATVERAIRYLGLHNLRDSAQNSSDYTVWRQVAQATGAYFDNYIAKTSPAGMQTDRGFITRLAHEGVLNFVEGGNEEDDGGSQSPGNRLAITAQFQQQVYALGQQLGLPVINMSFGAGCTSQNNWQGDYGKVGDLSAYADYANARIYPVLGQTPGYAINRLNGLAHLAASSRPVITTEIGWDENQGFSQTEIAVYTLDAALDGIKYGAVKTYFYALFNDGSGAFGLMNADGTPKPAGEALHNLTTLLHDSGIDAESFNSGSLNYSLSTNDDTILMEKSDGTFWLSIWNENAGSHQATLTLDSAAKRIALFNLLIDTKAIESVSNTDTFTFTVPNSPVIVEIVGAASGSMALDVETSGDSPIVIRLSDPEVAEHVSGATILASTRDHTAFIGRIETIQACQRGNPVTTSAGGNPLADIGSDNTNVLSAAGQGYDDIRRYVMTNSDLFPLSKFLQVSALGANAVIHVDPGGAAGGAGYWVATLDDTGPISLSSLLAHSIA